MARFPGPRNRNGRWTLRVRVPDDVRPTIKKLEISKSFGAVSRLEACRLARIERADIDQRFAEARAQQRQNPVAIVSESEFAKQAKINVVPGTPAFARLCAGIQRAEPSAPG